MSADAILDGLKRGERYAFDMLKNERDAIADFWNWWWDTKFDGSLERPYTVVNGDPILNPTADKAKVDTQSDDVLFGLSLRALLDRGIIPRGHHIDRQEFRSKMVEYFTALCPKADWPHVVFTGGGYGAGKTTHLHLLTDAGKLDFPTEAMQGVDYCKQLLPEFCLLKQVADGRASECCQEESRLISDMLFCQIVAEGRTFGWDSSMSDLEKTMRKISFARSKGYRMTLMAVLTQPKTAIERAMGRAKLHRRFAPPKYLESSHKGFAANLEKYVPLFDVVWVVENSKDYADSMSQSILAYKESLESKLVIVDESLYQSYVSNP